MGTPSNYQRLARLNSPEFRGQYIEAHGRTDLVFLMMDGLLVRDAFGYSVDAAGRLYVPVPPGVRVYVKDERRHAFFSARAFETDYATVLRAGSIDAMFDAGAIEGAGTLAETLRLAAAVAATLVLAVAVFILLRRRKHRAPTA